MSGEKQRAKIGDIQASGPGSLQWKSDQVRGSLDGLLRYVETEAAKTLAWYLDSKKPGQYRLVIAATTPENKPACATSIVVVKPCEVAKTSIRLPIGA